MPRSKECAKKQPSPLRAAIDAGLAGEGGAAVLPTLIAELQDNPAHANTVLLGIGLIKGSILHRDSLINFPPEVLPPLL